MNDVRENVIIQEGGKGARMRDVDHILTEDSETGELIPWVPESARKSGIKYVSKNGTYKAEDDGLHSWSKVNVGVIGGRQGTSAPSEDDGGRQVPKGEGRDYIIPAGIGHSVEGYDDYQGGDYTVNVVSGIAIDPETGMEKRGMPVLRYPFRDPKRAGEAFFPSQLKKGPYIVIATGNVSVGNVRTYEKRGDSIFDGTKFRDSSELFDTMFARSMVDGWVYSNIRSSGTYHWSVDVDYTVALVYSAMPTIRDRSEGSRNAAELVVGDTDSESNYENAICLYERVGGYSVNSDYSEQSPIDWFCAVHINSINYEVPDGNFADGGWSSEYGGWLGYMVRPKSIVGAVAQNLVGNTIYSYRDDHEDWNKVLRRAGMSDNDTLARLGSRIFGPRAEHSDVYMQLTLGMYSDMECYCTHGQYGEFDENVLYVESLEPSLALGDAHQRTRLALELTYKNIEYAGRYEDMPEGMVEGGYTK